MDEATVALIVGVLAAAVSVFVGVRQVLLKARLDEEAKKRDRERDAEQVLTRYREPLAAAAFELERRLYNILEDEFFETHGAAGARRDAAVSTTAFRIAQYFGWAEILRRDIQFLSFPEDDHTRAVIDLQYEIAGALLTDEMRYGTAMMLWTDEQRALGERMIVEEHGKVLCMGYGSFCDATAAEFAMLRRQIEMEIGDDGARQRIRRVQNLLCDLVEKLDQRRVRYTRDLDRA